MALRSVAVEAGSGVLSGAWALSVGTWDRKGSPAPIPHPFPLSRSMSLLHFIGKASLLLINLFQEGLAFALSLRP